MNRAHSPSMRCCLPALLGLLKSDDGYAVRVRVVLPTLAGPRAANGIAPGGMHLAAVHLPGCGGADTCPLMRFKAFIGKMVPASVVIPDSGNEPMAH